jgi:formylglycine-generating enzyme required for sulfatase activity/predicted Ser/Thr protein kinase
MDNPDTVVKQLFGEALDLPREQLKAFLDRTCKGRNDLRRQVEALLEENDRLNGIMSDSPWNLSAVFPENLPRGQRIVPGTLLGRYRIVEQLGAGGMGVVYRAHDEKLNRAVAVKVVTPGVFTTDEARSRFRHEALALARLNHPHIAALYDVGEQGGVDYIVMECVQGRSLRTVLQGGPFSVAEATRIVLQVAEALEEAHEHGVVHRDLKPANVMITAKGHAKVLDFGVAKLLAATEATQSLTEAAGPIGTPLYMSPEQALGKSVDARTDLWSLGVLYYEMLTARPPFQAESALAVLHSVIADRFPPVRELRPDVPEEADHIVNQAMQKDAERRYASAAEMARDASGLLAKLSGSVLALEPSSTRFLKIVTAAVAVVLIAGAAAGWWIYRLAEDRRWAREDAIPQIENLIEGRRPLVAFQVLSRAEKYLPGDGRLQQIRKDNAESVSITSDPPGAQVAIQDYLTPNGPTLKLGATPLKNVQIPKGYFRWTVSKTGVRNIVAAPETDKTMNFSLSHARTSPPGTVYVDGGNWTSYASFIGWVGPYTFPPYYIDRSEVSNREYQNFVDHGGYQKPEYWPAVLQKNGQAMGWSEAMQMFRDSTGRPGPSTWSGGHYPEGKADLPVSGVSWYEAAAYATFAGKSLPVLGQWYKAADFDIAEYTVQMSNLRSAGPSRTGTDRGLGPYGTYDMAGNVREWIANPVDGNLRFILGGSWKSPNYLYTSPEALPPLDRSDTNGFRCVRNLGAIPAAATEPIHRVTRDFAKYKPVSDEVFRAYTLLYAYPKTPLNAKVEGMVKETEDWREEKVSFDAAYNGERMAVYLFLPKRVRPPYQTVLFFPSARVLFLPPDSSALGDVNYFDYIIQSGRAVVYPIYKETYERRSIHTLPSGDIDLPIDWYKDAARTLDYLDTRPDIDKNRIGYLGVSVGSAEGVIIATLLQDRLKTAVFLDGGYFLQQAIPGIDQADFAPRMKKPVLMVNGRYDYTFPLETSQEPLFRMLGTPPADKNHVVLDTPHDVTQQRARLIQEVLGWLDRYLGRVN